jgi:hypothetical protein
MGHLILSGKRVLAVDDEPDVLMLLVEEIQSACSDCQDRANGVGCDGEQGSQIFLESWKLV